MNVRVSLGVLIAVAAVACGGADDAATPTTAPPTTEPPTTVRLADDVRLNELQAIGTHNSFHVAPDPAEAALMEALDPEQAAERQYTHRPIGEQLADQRIRQVELDVFADPDGGLYGDPVFRRQAGLGPYDAPGIDTPGTKVLHEQDVDYRTVCVTLVACLRDVRRFSEAHPDHAPIAVHIQFKDGPLIFNVPEQAVPVKWTPALMDDLDAEIVDALGRDRIVTPDDVRGGAATLEEAVVAGGWPTLGESRGKVLLFMVNGDPYRSLYLDGHPALAGRVMFTNAEPGQDDAAYVGVDDPVADGARITELVRQGYLVRTRADTPGVEAVAGDTARLEAALASGAQWVSTDYPGPDGARPTLGTSYVAQLPGFAPVRCNPVTATDACDDTRLEPPPG